MKATFSGRVLFGASAALYGVASLLWHGSELWQRLRPLGTSFGSAIAWVLTIALVAAGVALIVPRSARVASVVLGAIFGVFTLACVLDMIAAPATYGSYVDFFEQLSVVCGAIAVYAATESHPHRAAMFARAARLGLGVCAVSFAWAQVVYAQYTASLVPTWIPPNPMFWTDLTTIAFALAALAILIDRQARLAMRLMALMLAIVGALVWVPTIVSHPATLSNWSEFGLNYLITAAAMLVADVTVSA